MIKNTSTRYAKKFYYHSNDAVIGKSINLYGEYSQIEVDFILGMLNKNCVVYDIGANIGYHTTAFAHAAGFVYSFEPNFQNYTLLTKNTSFYKNVCLINAAVSDKNGIINVDDYDPAISGNFGNIKIGSGEKQVISIDLDSFEIDKPDFIKIDVEGAELAVLTGLQNIIIKHRPVIYYEAHETPNFSEIYHLLKSKNYSLYWCQINNFNPNNYLKNNKNVFGDTALFSVLAVPQRPISIGLDEVIGPDDTWKKLIARVNLRK